MISFVSTYGHGGNLAKSRDDDLQQQRCAAVGNYVARGAWHSGTNNNKENAQKSGREGRAQIRLAGARQQQPSPQHHPVAPPLDYVWLPYMIDCFANNMNVLFCYNVIHSVCLLI